MTQRKADVIVFLAALAFLAIVLVAVTWGQTPTAPPTAPPKPLVPTHDQLVLLQTRQDDLRAAYQDLQSAQYHYNKMLVALQSESERVKAANKWPAATTFDPNTLAFAEPAPKAEVKK